MKIGGVVINGPAEEVLVLPRPTGTDIIIRCKAVLDMSPFEAMCPEPKAKPILVQGGFKADDKDPGFLKQCAEHAQMRFDYIALNSMSPSNIEWDSVVMDQPGTWREWEDELQKSGISSIEVNRIIVCVMQANSLDESKLEEARATFLRGLEAESVKSSGPDTEQKSTQSGEPANDSE